MAAVTVNTFNSTAVTERIALPLYIRTVFDATTVTDFTKLPFYLIITDSTTVTDFAHLGLRVTEATAVTDSVTVAVPVAPRTISSNSPTVAVTELIQLPFYVLGSETVTLTEAVRFPFWVAVNESTAVTEALLFPFVVVVGELVTVLEQVQLPFYLLLADSTAVTEFAALDHNVMEAVTVSEGVSVLLRTVGVEVNDGLTLTEWVSPGLVLVEMLVMTELTTLALALTPTGVDSIDSIDSTVELLPVLFPTSIIDSTLVMTDSVLFSWPFHLGVVDTLDLIDAVATAVTPPLPSCDETCLIAESCTLALDLWCVVGEEVEVQEQALSTVLGVANLLLTLDDTVFATDEDAALLCLPALNCLAFEAILANIDGEERFTAANLVMSLDTDIGSAGTLSDGVLLRIVSYWPPALTLID